MADGSNSEIDKLLEKARNLAAKPAPGSDPAKGEIKGGIKKSVVGDTLNNIKAFNQTVDTVRGGGSLVKQGFKTAWSYVKRLWPVRAYAWAYKKCSYKKDKKTGEMKARPFGRTASRITTAFLLSAALPSIMGVPLGAPARTVIGGAAETVSDAARMTFFMEKHQKMFLNDEHISDPVHNTWIVKGMTKQGGDWDKDGITLRAKHSLMNDIWNFAHKGDPFFMPDRVVAPVAPGNQTEYDVTYYGARWRLAYWLQNYPDVLDIKVIPNGSAGAAFNPAANQSQPAAPAASQAAPAAPAAQAPGR
jgi:hypothetical protein